MMKGIALTLAWTLLVMAFSGFILLLWSIADISKSWLFPAFVGLRYASGHDMNVSSLWYPPRDTEISNLDRVVNAEGVYGFIFNNSATPKSNDYYGGYNYCNMPHVNKQAYTRAPDEYTLGYVEVVSRLVLV